MFRSWPFLCKRLRPLVKFIPFFSFDAVINGTVLLIWYLIWSLQLCTIDALYYCIQFIFLYWFSWPVILLNSFILYRSCHLQIDNFTSCFSIWMPFYFLPNFPDRTLLQCCIEVESLVSSGLGGGGFSLSPLMMLCFLEILFCRLNSSLCS